MGNIFNKKLEDMEEIGKSVDTLKDNEIDISDSVLEKWQNIVDILAKVNNVPVALIMKIDLPDIRVFRSSQSEGNPYKVGDKEHLIGSGLYCENVINEKKMLLVPNALKDKDWDHNPDIKLNMISYMGFPLLYPDGRVFGTICILDSKENIYNDNIRELLFQFKQVIEDHLHLLYLNKKLERSEKEYRQLVDLANTIIIKLDKNANIQFINRYGEKLLGYRKDELIGRNVVGTIVPKTDTSGQDLEIMVNEVFNSPDKFKIKENENITKDGRKLWVSWANEAIIDEKGKFIGILSIGTDITEKKKAEQKLKESEERYKKAYKEVNFYKDLFSHDISNSIQTISSQLATYFYKKNKGQAPVNVEDLLEKMQKSTERAVNIIYKVRKLSEIEDREISIQIIELGTVLRKTIENIKKIYDQKKIEIAIESNNNEVYVLANDLLENVIENIIINAITYNKNTKIEILIKISEINVDERDIVKIEFIDNGIGISDEKKKIIFKKGAKKITGSKGMGLGLSLVKKIIETYQGKILVEDRIEGDPSQGSNFSVLIPKT